MDRGDGAGERQRQPEQGKQILPWRKQAFLADMSDDDKHLIERQIVKKACLISVQAELAAGGYLIVLDAIPDGYQHG